MLIDETWRTLRGLEKKWIKIVKMPEDQGEEELPGSLAVAGNNLEEQTDPSPDNENNVDDSNAEINAETN